MSFLLSKYKQLLQDLSKHNSSITFLAIFLSTLHSFFAWGNKSMMSLIKCLNLALTPLEQITSVLYLFFHSFEFGSGSLKALSSFSYWLVLRLWVLHYFPILYWSFTFGFTLFNCHLNLINQKMNFHLTFLTQSQNSFQLFLKAFCSLELSCKQKT